MSTSSHIRLCVVTPIGNEAESIQSFLEEVQKQLDVHDRHLLIIDNCSQDDTRAIVERFIEQNQGTRVELIEAPENRCIRDAYVRGYREALKRKAQWVLEMDAGFSHEPASIPEFIVKMQEGYDYAGASRFMPDSSYSGGIFRRILSQGGTILSKVFLRCAISDMTSGFQCYTRETLEYVLECGVESEGGFFQTEIRYWVSFRKWVEVPIDYGNTKRTVPAKYILDGVRGLLRLVKRSISPAPSVVVSKSQVAL